HCTDTLLDCAAANTTSANPCGAIRALGRRNMDRLQVRAERPAGNTCHLGSHSTEVFCFTAYGDLVAGDRLASAYFTGLSHSISPSDSWRLAIYRIAIVQPTLVVIQGGRGYNKENGVHSVFRQLTELMPFYELENRPMRRFFVPLLMILPLFLGPSVASAADPKRDAVETDQPVGGDKTDQPQAGPNADADADKADSEKPKPQKTGSRPTSMAIIPAANGLKTLTIHFRWTLIPKGSIEVRLVPGSQPKGAAV